MTSLYNSHFTSFSTERTEVSLSSITDQNVFYYWYLGWIKHAASYTTYCLEYWFRFLPCKHRTSVNFYFTWFPITKEKNVWHVIIVFIEFRTYSCEEKTILSQLGNSENQILHLQLYMSSIWKCFSQTGFLLPVFQVLLICHDPPLSCPGQTCILTGQHIHITHYVIWHSGL